MKSLIVFALALIAASISPTERMYAQEFVVIVNTANTATSMSKGVVSDIFLKKNNNLTAVDRDKNSRIRAAFSKSAHGRSSSVIEPYWVKQIFSGKDVPPMEKSSDAEVIAFVRANTSAIGYVSPGAELGTGVRILAVTGML